MSRYDARSWWLSGWKLNLLGTPSSVCVPHVCRGFDRRNEFEDYVADANDADNETCDPLPPGITNDDRADEDVDFFASIASCCSVLQHRLTDSAADEGEHERRIAGDLGRYLELW